MAKDATTPAQTETETAVSYDEALSQARSKAMTRLREKYRTEHNDIIRELMAEAGHEWKPRPTKEEKAEAELRKLLAENPSLKEKVALIDELPVAHAEQV